MHFNTIFLAAVLVMSASAVPLKKDGEVAASVVMERDVMDEGKRAVADKETEEVDAGLFTALDGVWQSYGYDE
ncbi:hypothetical protein MAC_09652 [Metarhizium acridum CQMa 102]|uniref:RxLR effector protein n=1 Tax=Metarhizium acridum (strain CQMa 102) TaxID=655827 RepID=E9EIF4_METAQ|nr:uncharacterized protein MAC_09652 [Metarhizium acridum CQMa 102]EFY84301.1 hypothetical protein MAC_09652 [Metarhizium acridum CQMa 102]